MSERVPATGATAAVMCTLIAAVLAALALIPTSVDTAAEVLTALCVAVWLIDRNIR